VSAAALALGACAGHESLQRQAALNCQAVGISEKDPQFGTCTQAYSRARIEERLEQSYIDALNAYPSDAQRYRPRGHGF
jgi:hypothetical protein